MAVSRTIAGNIALRWSAGRCYKVIYKHLAPLEPERCLVTQRGVG